MLKKDTPCPKTKKKPQWDGRRDEITIKSNSIPAGWVTHKLENSKTKEVLPLLWRFWTPHQASPYGDLTKELGIHKEYGHEGQRHPHCGRILYQLSHEESLRILEWVAYPFSSRSSWPRNQTRVSFIAGRFFTNWATREALKRRRLTQRCPGRGASSKWGPDIHLCLSKDKTCLKKQFTPQMAPNPGRVGGGRTAEKERKGTGCWSASIYTDRASLVAQLVKNPPAMRETWVRSLGWEDPLEKGKVTHSIIFSLENSMDCIAHGVTKSQMLLSEGYTTLTKYRMKIIGSSQ